MGMGGGLTMAAFLQWSSSFDTDGSSSKLAASIAGLGVTEERLPDTVSEGRSNTAKIDLDVGRVVYEASFQLFLQGSAVMAAGIPIIEQPVLLISMIFSALTGMRKLKGLWKDCWL